MTQQTELFNETILHNIRYGCWDASENAVIEAAKRARAHDFISGFPEGYDTRVGPNGQRLSGGQRQRISLARAILRNAEILILDEATSQIDVDSETLIHDALAEFGKGRTMIMISHRQSTLALATEDCASRPRTINHPGTIGREGRLSASLTMLAESLERLQALQLREITAATSFLSAPNSNGNMKILVTGGAGYIGSVTVERLVAAGATVVVFDNLSLGHRAAVHPRATLVEGDLRNRGAIDAVLEQFRAEAVLHFAAHSSVGQSMQRPFEYLGDNVTCGLNLLQSMVAHDVLRLVFSSTACVYKTARRGGLAELLAARAGQPLWRIEAYPRANASLVGPLARLALCYLALFQRRRR